MAYQIDRYNNSLLTVVEDGTIDQSTDLKFIGKNYAGYGEIQNENFLFLLENFAGANQPPRAIAGQIWYDSASSKVKFYDGTQFRVAGSSTVSNAAPAGLSTGDFWWDSTNQQLYAYNGSTYVLVGPQGTGDGTTQLVSTTVRDDVGNQKSIIQAVVDDEVIYVISAQTFYLDQTLSPIAGFDYIRAGLTLKDTANTGITSSNTRFFGTASDSDRLGGLLAADYIQSANPTFTNQVRFSDSGISIGDSNDLKIYLDINETGVIKNETGESIEFYIKDNLGVVQFPLRMTYESLLPGITYSAPNTGIDIGSPIRTFRTTYTNFVEGAARRANTLQYDGIDVGANSGNYAQASINNTLQDGNGNNIPSVAVRQSNGTLNAVRFQGISTLAEYADLAEKYTTDEEAPVGTVMSVSISEDYETEPCNSSDHPIGIISENPAYLMNSAADGQALALKGRVPVRTVGPVKKGDKLYVVEEGVVSSSEHGAMVGIALESNSQIDEKLIECIITL